MIRGSDFLSPAGRSLLCVRSRRVDRFADEVLKPYKACVVHDAKTACRKARLGAFDAYLAIDLRSVHPASYMWENIRSFDANTPFVLVVAKALPLEFEERLQCGYDALIVESSDPAHVAGVIQQLLLLAERRSLEARRIEALAVQDDIAERLERLEQRMQLSRQSLARTQEHIMRAHAVREFERCGGTKSFFERLWPDTFEEALERSYTRRMAPEPDG